VHPQRWLAGRRLAFSPMTLARPALGVGVLMFVLGSATGIWVQMQASSRDAAARAFVTDWRSPQPGDIKYILSRLPAAVTAPIDANGTAWFASCDAAASIISQGACSSSSTDQVLSALEEQTHIDAKVGEMPPQPDVFAQGLFVFSSTLSIENVEAAVAGLPAGNTASLGPAGLRPPLSAGWLAGGAMLAGALLVASALHSFANRALAALEEDHTLLALGLEDGQVRAVQKWTVSVPLIAVIPVATAAAMAFTWSASSSQVAAIALPQVLAEALVVSAASALVVVIVSRAERRNLTALTPRGRLRMPASSSRSPS
jgi:hypothetical protein